MSSVRIAVREGIFSLGENSVLAQWIEVEEVRTGVFCLVAESMTEADGQCARCALGFADWNDDVENLDDFYELSGFRMSNRLKWRDIIMTPEVFFASSLKRLEEALRHVSFYAYCPEDL